MPLQHSSLSLAQKKLEKQDAGGAARVSAFTFSLSCFCSRALRLRTEPLSRASGKTSKTSWGCWGDSEWQPLAQLPCNQCDEAVNAFSFREVEGNERHRRRAGFEGNERKLFSRQSENQLEKLETTALPAGCCR